MEQNETPKNEAETQATEDQNAQATESSQEQPELSLEEQLKEAEHKAQEHYDAWIYAKAETDNIRRRSTEDVSKAQKFAVEKFSTEILAVKDSLDAALAIESATVESYKDGMELTAKQLTSIFEKFNIAELNPVGEKLDPHKHQAISAIDSEEPANTIINVMQKGYMLHDRVLRPAMVVVAKSK